MYFYVHYDYELRNMFKNSILKFHKTITLFLLVEPYFPPQTVIYTGHVNGEPQNPQKKGHEKYTFITIIGAVIGGPELNQIEFCFILSFLFVFITHTPGWMTPSLAAFL